MTTPAAVTFAPLDLDALAGVEGVIACFVPEAGTLDPGARRLNRLTRGALKRAVEGDAFEALSAGDALKIGFPVGMAVSSVLVIKLERRAPRSAALAAGASIAKARGTGDLTILAGAVRRLSDVVLGAVLRSYDFADHKTAEPKPAPAITVLSAKPDEARAAYADASAQAEGVFFTRDLVNEPSNILTTTEFADRLSALSEHGVEVEVLEEDKLAELGMRTLLAVGQGSVSPSKVVVMRWNGGGDENPFALIGKGVVFDTGGISLKPAAGMEDMTMDMGGAGTVAGAMLTLARRKAKANVVGIVGLVENMPDGNAIRPGDVVASMKGDTVEIINTDAEGRLVLCDIMWYAQERFEPVGMVDLATLTGAIIIGLGHENAGVFSNDDTLAGAFLKAAAAEEEGAWRMPLGKAYDKQLKSRVADMKNVGGRPAGSITAAQFLQRFVKEGTPWMHLDIAGVASVKGGTALSPDGATGWGVRALDRLVRDTYEAKPDAADG
ncbi:putative cytosol aminopeptidase [Jannaschia pagri]|uniref:Probable cytosol aminopeptidase n=1 Tax=Jannaschia pagri TaxID=2829797 RepID=A0ABQ4NH24_9RHOB|nr:MULTISPECIES: leucyl aminopeptidase [unclassified Jannaschia]GIT90430.1 putative cytosol aminopeptidase [Jannaschia sp. AI_61]GIT93465.1 putative cytosol aminopeptidase [Jannaschia sp. AI_62]